MGISMSPLKGQPFIRLNENLQRHHFNMGYVGFYFNHLQGSPELLILNPKEFVTGAIWVDFEEGELQSRCRAMNGAFAIEAIFKAWNPIDLERLMSL